MLAHIHPCTYLVYPQSRPPVDRRRKPGSLPGRPTSRMDRQMPRAPSPGAGVTRTGAASRAASEGVTPPSKLIRAHAPDQKPSHRFRFPYSAGLCRLLPAPAGSWSFPTLSLRDFPWMLGPILRWVAGAYAGPLSMLHRRRRPSPNRERVGFPTNLRPTTSGRERFRSCSHSLMFRPPGLLATQVVPTGGAVTCATPRQPWRLPPSRTHVVTFVRIGYASRPNRAIAGRGLSPHQSRSLVGCSPRSHSHLHSRLSGYSQLLCLLTNALQPSTRLHHSRKCGPCNACVRSLTENVNLNWER